MIKIFIGIFCFLAIFSCNNDDNISTAQVNSITTTTIDDGMTLLEIRIHDELATDGEFIADSGMSRSAMIQNFKKSGKTVTELNITVKEINIVNADGEVVPCPMKEVKRLNILDIAKSNPVVLSSVPRHGWRAYHQHTEV
jgi:alkyl hydroperoxide reductase subunit AhpC